MKLTNSAIKTIETWRLGFVATVSASGRPYVSPKGTFVVLDKETIAFGEIRSPQTITNLQVNPELEINFVDMLIRKGVRIRGRAVFLRKGSAEFDVVLPEFLRNWGDLCDRFNLIVKIPVDDMRPVTSPVYDDGAVETELKSIWRDRISKI